MARRSSSHPEELNRLLAKIRLGENLSPWLLLAGFIFVVGEALLANRFAAQPAVEKKTAALGS